MYTVQSTRLKRWHFPACHMEAACINPSTRCLDLGNLARSIDPRDDSPSDPLAVAFIIFTILLLALFLIPQLPVDE